MIKTLLSLFIFSASLFAQCGSMAVNPSTGKLDCVGTPITTTQSGTPNQVVKTGSDGSITASGPVSTGSGVPTSWFTGVGLLGFPDTTCGGTVPATYGYISDCSGVASWIHGSTVTPLTPTPVAAPWCIPWAGCTWGQNTKTMNAHETYFVKMVVPWPGYIVSQIGITLPYASSAYAVMGFYDAACTTLLAATTPIQVSNVVYNQLLFSSAITLKAGQVVYFAITSDGPVLYNAPIISSLPYLTNNEGSSTYSVFQGNDSTGSTSGLTLPSTCGTRTAVGTSIVVPTLYFH